MDLGGVRFIPRRGEASWKTEKRYIPHDRFAEDVLLELIKDRRPFLDRIAESGNFRIRAAIVKFSKGGRAGPGLYLSTELVKALAELGADLDYDPY